MKNAILDTNIFLHYDIKSVDWCEELGTDSVNIIVCPTVLKELDEKKSHHNRTIAERARKNISLIESLDSTGAELRRNVNLVASGMEPRVEWERQGLDPDVNDDRMIAFILTREDADDVLVTDDAAPRIKARKRNLTTVELKSERLEEPKSDTEKELERVKSELAISKDRSPVLSLLLESGWMEGSLRKFSLKRPKELSESEIDKEVETRKQELELDLRYRIPYMSGSMMETDIEAYNKEVENHLQNYRDYLKAKRSYEQRMWGIIEMKFVLDCSGRATAQGIYCEMIFPEGFQILKSASIPKALTEPDRPVPTSRLQRMFSSSRYPEIGRVLDPESFLSREPVRTLGMKIDANILAVRLDKLQHGFTREIPTVFIKVPSIETSKNFQIEYEIHAENLPTPAKGIIPVGLEK